MYRISWITTLLYQFWYFFWMCNLADDPIGGFDEFLMEIFSNIDSWCVDELLSINMIPILTDLKTSQKHIILLCIVFICTYYVCQLLRQLWTDYENYFTSIFTYVSIL